MEARLTGCAHLLLPLLHVAQLGEHLLSSCTKSSSRFCIFTQCRIFLAASKKPIPAGGLEGTLQPTLGGGKAGKEGLEAADTTVHKAEAEPTVGACGELVVTVAGTYRLQWEGRPVPGVGARAAPS
jgi:hypothetical protein